MRKKTLRISILLIFMAIYLSACANQTNQAISPSSPVALETKAGSIATQVAPSQTSTVVPVEVSLDIRTINPSNRLVALSELDLEPATRILVYDPKSEQVLSISGKSVDVVPNIQSGVNTLADGIEMSPDRRWFAYLEINEGFNIRVSSIDGAQHFIGIKNAVGSSFRWLSNDKIAVYNKLGFWMECPSEMQIFNPFSEESEDVPYISSQGSPSCFPIPYFNPDLSKALYLSLYNEKGWKIYDYKTQTSHSVLPGLDTSPGGDKYFFYWGENGLSFVMPDSEKIMYAFDIPESEFIFAPPLNTIPLPDSTVNEDETIEFWIPEEQVVGLILDETDSKAVLGCDVPQTFVVINLATLELNNYCLNPSWYFGQTGRAWFTYFSADHRFVGWTIRELPSNSEPLATVILDTTTGKLSYLEDYEFLGFGELTR
jgi:hypothetical protein